MYKFLHVQETKKPQIEHLTLFFFASGLLRVLWGAGSEAIVTAVPNSAPPSLCCHYLNMFWIFPRVFDQFAH